MFPPPRPLVPAHQDDRVGVRPHNQPRSGCHGLLAAVAAVMVMAAAAVVVAVRWGRGGVETGVRGGRAVAGQLCFAVKFLLDGDLAVRALGVVTGAHVFGENHAVRLGRVGNGCLQLTLTAK